MPNWKTSQIRNHVSRRIEPVSLDAETSYASLGIRYSTGVYIRDVKLGSQLRTKMYRAHAGDFIYCILDSQRGPFDIVPDEFDHAVVTNKFPLYQVGDDLNPKYLRLLFTHVPTLKAIGKARAGSDGRSEWKPEMFEAHEFPLPPLNFQTRIVDIIAAIEETIDATSAEAASMHRVLVGTRDKLINTGFPEAQARDAFDIRLGRQRSPERATGPSMTPYMRSYNVGYDELRLDDVLSMDFNDKERERYRLEDGDVLVSEGSASPTAVGMPAVWRGEIDGPVCFQNTLLRFRAIEGTTTPAFTRHWCLWAYEAGEFLETAGEAPGVRHIGFKKASAMKVMLPSLEEQEDITAVLDPIADAVAALKAEADRLRTLRDALLDALLAGDIKPIVSTTATESEE